MTEQEMKILHERMKKEDPKLLALVEKCFDAGVLSGKEQAQRTWVGLTVKEKSELWEVSRAALPRYATYASLVEAKLKEKNHG